MNIIDSINKSNRAEGDYIKDGLLYCGQCHTPKQCRCDDGFLSGKLLSINCMCTEETLEQERNETQRKKNEELRARCLPLVKMHTCTFERADEAKAIQISKRYVEHWEKMKKDGTGLTFCGNVGTGKSFAALCIANALIDRGIAVKYITSADIVSRIMKDQNQEEFIRSLCASPLLIIDDIGAEHDSAYSQAQLCRVIEARRESGKPFICTTNYSLQEMESAIEHSKQRIFDRILASTVPVVVDGQSRRKDEGANRLETAKQLLT